MKAPLASLLAAMALAATQAAAQAPSAGLAHPALWPRAHSAGLIDPKREAFVGRLLKRMTLEQKVGQMIQGDLTSLKPEDLKTYPLGSFLAGAGERSGAFSGGESPPARKEPRG